MTKFNETFWLAVEEHIKNGNITKQKHPSKELYVLNYSKEASYNDVWDEVTIQCRGLIVDKNNNVVAHVMPKFWNDFELEKMGLKLPLLPFEVYEKLDGSMVSLSCFEDEWIFATRGSFVSEQAIEAKKIFEELYSYDYLAKGETYIFECIYYTNRIVVDYGQRRDLVLLTIYDKDGNEISDVQIENYTLNFTRPQKYDFQEFHKIKAAFNHLPGEEAEGFVVKFENNFRTKIKLDNYFVLHRLMTNVSERDIHEYLSQEKPLDDFYKTSSEEIRFWLDSVVNRMRAEFAEIESKVLRKFIEAKEQTTTQKDFALHILKDKSINNSILFAMYHKHNYKPIIWKSIYPQGNKVFRKVSVEET